MLSPLAHRRLRALTEAAGTRAYPDTDNQMEAGVFSFAKRDDETRVWRELVDVALGAGAKSDGVALDAGCGLGAHARSLAERFADVVLLDADARRARAAAEAAGLRYGERVFVARVDDSSLAHADLVGAFRFVQLVQVLGHVPLRAVAPTLAAMRHVLAADGHLLVAVPFTGGPFDLTFETSFSETERRVRPVAIEARAYDQLAREPQDGRLPVRHFSMTSLLSALAMAGFDVVVSRPYHWFSHDTGDIFALARPRLES